MRFNFEAYEKVYPSNVEPPKTVESAVDTFKPTEEKVKDQAPGEETPKPEPEVTPAAEPENSTPEIVPESEVNENE